jgi:hypothetical protein
MIHYVLHKILPEKEVKSVAPLQKRALYSLVIGIALTIALIVFFIARGGAAAFDEDQKFRLVVYAFWVGVPLVYLILVKLTLRKPEQVDERDRLVIDRSVRTQWLAVIFSLAAWTVTLTELYWAQRQVPLVFLNIMFISILIISTLAQSLGILIGYWRIARNG